MDAGALQISGGVCDELSVIINRKLSIAEWQNHYATEERKMPGVYSAGDDEWRVDLQNEENDILGKHVYLRIEKLLSRTASGHSGTIIINAKGKTSSDAKSILGRLRKTSVSVEPLTEYSDLVDKTFPRPMNVGVADDPFDGILRSYASKVGQFVLRLDLFDRRVVQNREQRILIWSLLLGIGLLLNGLLERMGLQH